MRTRVPALLALLAVAVAGRTESTVIPLGARVVDAERSAVSNRITYVTDDPPVLTVFDPTDGSQRSTPLPLPPLAVSVQPDGNYAAVAHENWISYVRLESATVEAVFAVGIVPHDILLTDSGYIYLFPSETEPNIYSYEIATKLLTPTRGTWGRSARLAPGGQAFYTARQDLIARWDVSGGVAELGSPYPLTLGCGDVWLSPDGDDTLTACRHVWRTDSVTWGELELRGFLPEVSELAWADYSDDSASIAAIASIRYTEGGPTPAASQVHLYDAATLELTGRIAVPPAPGSEDSSSARWVFWNRGSRSLCVIQESTRQPNGTSSLAILSTADVRAVKVTRIANSASGVAASISAGELISLFGEGLGPEQGVGFSLDPVTGHVPRALGGTEVYIGGIRAPLLFSSANQVNAVVPFESWRGDVWVVNDDRTSTVTSLQVGGLAPGVFTVNGSGSGQAVAVNQDGSLADPVHPAAPGSYLTVYFTGGGETVPSGVTGAVAGADPRPHVYQPNVTVGGVNAEVTYAGSAPYFIEGLSQLNVRVGSATPTGDAVPLVMTYFRSTPSSQPGVTIAVR